MEDKDKICSCSSELKRDTKIIEEHSFVWQMMKQYNETNKRLIVALIIIVVLWFSTIAGFTWLWNQYDYYTTTQDVTQSADNDGSNTFVGGDMFGCDSED